MRDSKFEVKWPISPRDGLLRLVWLLTTGAIAAFCLAWLLSGRISNVPTGIAAEISLFLTWHALQVTALKLGLDNLLFARFSKSGETGFDLRTYRLYWVLPGSVVGSTLIASIFGWVILPFSMVAAFCDVSSAIFLCAANAKGRTGKSGLSTLLNIPLALLIFVAALSAFSPGILLFCIAFAISSLIRCAFLSRQVRLSIGVTPIPAIVFAVMGIQQLLNYALFRMDQLALGLRASLGFLGSVPDDDVARYLVLSKGFEIACGVWIAIGVIFFPLISEHWRTRRRSAVFRALATWWGAAAAASGIAIAVATAMLAQSNRFLPYFIVAMSLALFANYETYVCLSKDRLNRLICGLAFSVAIGAVYFTLSGASESLDRLVALLPIQLLTFVVTMNALNCWVQRDDA